MKYSKDEILGMYLNQIYYGHGSYGIEAAAMMYFDKHASELSLAESAMLAGIPKGPKYYSPYLDMKNAKDRQYVILEAMKEGGSITEEQAAAAYAEVLSFQPIGTDEQEGFAPYFRDYIRYLAVEKYGKSLNLDQKAQELTAEKLIPLVLTPETEKNGLFTMSKEGIDANIASINSVGISMTADELFDTSIIEEAFAGKNRI